MRIDIVRLRVCICNDVRLGNLRGWYRSWGSSFQKTESLPEIREDILTLEWNATDAPHRPTQTAQACAFAFAFGCAFIWLCLLSWSYFRHLKSKQSVMMISLLLWSVMWMTTCCLPPLSLLFRHPACHLSCLRRDTLTGTIFRPNGRVSALAKIPEFVAPFAFIWYPHEHHNDSPTFMSEVLIWSYFAFPCLKDGRSFWTGSLVEFLQHLVNDWGLSLAWSSCRFSFPRPWSSFLFSLQLSMSSGGSQMRSEALVLLSSY